ncbi:MAG TPA: PTO1314 family radical SAM protein [Thermoplasmata archaeon]|nr:PTO1314 family radical SAM protein [Thermoplasmata archaeon]
MAFFEPVVLRSLKRATREARGQKLPVIAGHKLLYRCNLECKMCPFWRREDEELLSLSQEIRMMDALVRTGVSFLGFEGGEPMLRRDLPEILRESHDRFHTSLVTNGWLLQQRLPEIARSLELLFVSLDGIGPMHDFLRGIPRSFERAIEGIKAARERLPVAISSTITKDNIYHAVPLVDLAESMGVSITFQVAYDYSTADAMSPMGPDLLEVLRELRLRRVNGAPILESPDYFDAIINSWYRQESWHCKPWMTMNVDPQGRIVLPCYTLHEYAGQTPVWETDVAALWNSYDWSKYETCNKCALACYLEPSIFSWSNVGMIRDRILSNTFARVARTWRGPNPAMVPHPPGLLTS